eukprot:TRINITY_DN31736_c0_g1_i1.p1 TRINITY_DN31736_c0_g1~~TRINITY_DN31736_c0_g1_i1.p1  ORF type:complete len:250 (-),score=19.67 TRINITY_DN31736_c0_g1_i1:60-749(-)
MCIRDSINAEYMGKTIREIKLRFQDSNFMNIDTVDTQYSETLVENDMESFIVSNSPLFSPRAERSLDPITLKMYIERKFKHKHGEISMGPAKITKTKRKLDEYLLGAQHKFVESGNGEPLIIHDELQNAYSPKKAKLKNAGTLQDPKCSSMFLSQPSLTISSTSIEVEDNIRQRRRSSLRSCLIRCYLFDFSTFTKCILVLCNQILRSFDTFGLPLLSHTIYELSLIHI